MYIKTATIIKIAVGLGNLAWYVSFDPDNLSGILVNRIHNHDDIPFYLLILSSILGIGDILSKLRRFLP
jgi:hypothetical protein